MNRVRALLKITAAVTVSLIICLLPVAKAVADITPNWDLYCITGGDCPLYDPAGCNTTDTSATASSGPVDTSSLVPDDQIPGGSRPEKEWNYLIALGFTPVQAAGIYGNIGREGVFDPESIENGDEQYDPQLHKMVGRTKNYEVFKKLTAPGHDGYGLIGFTPGLSLMEPNIGGGADWSGIANVKVTKDNFYYISTQLEVVYGYMKNSNAPDGKNMLQEYQNKATSPAAAASAFQDLVENAGVVADGVRDHIANAGMNKFGHGGNGAGGATTAFASFDTSGQSGGGSSSDSSGCCGAGSSATTVADTSTSITGDLQSLAQQVLQNKNITFDYGDNGKVAANFKLMAKGEMAQRDSGKSVNVQPIVLVALLYLAQDHKVQVSSLTDGPSHDSASDPHGMGDAMDLDVFDGTWTNGSDAAAKKMVSILEQVLPSGSNFGMGAGPFSGTQTVDGKSFTAFGDNPNHLHFDVVGVDQSADDKAVAAAGGGGQAAQPGQAQTINASYTPSAGTTNTASQTCCPSSTSSSGNSTTSAGNVTLIGKTPAEQAFNYLTGQGGSPADLSGQAAAGIIGNMMEESGGNTENLDTHAHNDISGTHDGIVQWSTSRWNQLKSHESGKNPYDLATQLDFTWWEFSKGGYQSVLAKLRKVSSAADAAAIVNSDYEVSGVSPAQRQANARKIFKEYGSGLNGGAASATVSSTSCTQQVSQKSVNIIKHDAFGNADGLMGHKPTMIGLHYTAGNEQTVDQLVKDLSDPTGAKGCNKSCSVQLTVDPKGNVYQLTSRLDVITENIINFNDADIGIEIMGKDEQTLLNNTAQFNAVTALVTQLMQQYNIQMVQDFPNKAGLMGHMECDQWSQAHLGNHFKGIYKNDPAVGSTDSHTDPGAMYMKKVRSVVGPALNGQGGGGNGGGTGGGGGSFGTPV